MVDYELAAIHGIRISWPETRIRGCLFHFDQCIRRNLVNNGLQKLYMYDAHFRKSVRMMMSLPFLPVHLIANVYTEIIQDVSAQKYVTQQVADFLNYFTNNWVNLDAKLPRELWCQFGNLSFRTTNDAEGFHHGFNVALSCVHPGLFKFIHHIQLDHQKNLIDFQEFERTNSLPKYQRSKYRQLNDQLAKLNEAFGAGQMQPLRFVELVSNLMTH